MNRWFDRVARWTAEMMGHPVAFIMATGSVFLWLICGPLFQWSDSWQLWINTTTTILTFLMVFLIQHSQNRDTRGVQLKLDEMIRAIPQADNQKIGIEQSCPSEEA